MPEAEEKHNLGCQRGGWESKHAGGVRVLETGSMRIVVKSKNGTVTPIAKEYAQKKVSKLGRFIDDTQSVLAEVTLRSENETQIAEVTLRVGGLILRGEGQRSEMHGSIDEAVARIERQFEKYRTRIQKRIQSARSMPDTVAAAAPKPESEEDQVVRVKRFAMRPMAVDEAIMQMEMLDHDFFVFANAETGAVNVVYRRRDKGYGLIEPVL